MSHQQNVAAGEQPFRFRYEPQRLRLPSDASPMLHAHGWAVDDGGNILLLYEPNVSVSEEPMHRGATSRRRRSATTCLIRWRPDGTNGLVLNASTALCAGVPHSLRLTHEDDGTPVLYHTHNNGGGSGVLHKTTLDLSPLWTVKGPPSRARHFLPNMPTWAATPPGSFVYLADGYGTSKVHAYFKSNGTYANYTFGGKNRDRFNPAPPGLFSTAHSINYDERTRQLIVSDRGNHGCCSHRHHYLDFVATAKRDGGLAAPTRPEVRFAASFSIPELPQPCTFNVAPDGVHAVVPSLDGPVGIVNASNQLVSKVDVGGLLGGAGHRYPHDAVLLPGSGDLVVATWNPGRLSYWRRIRGTRSGGSDTSDL